MRQGTEGIIIADGRVEINLFYSPLATPSSTGSGGTGTDPSSTPPLNRGEKAMKLQGFIAVILKNETEALFDSSCLCHHSHKERESRLMAGT